MQQKFSSLSGAQKAFLVGLIVWFLLQLSRAIAWVLIGEINAGGESKAWMYPAYLDLFAVVFALPLSWATWSRRGVVTWAFVVMYWTISIVDHGGNFVTTTIVGPPSIAEDMNPYLIPVIQTIVDVVFLVLLFLPPFRTLFFRVHAASE